MNDQIDLDKTLQHKDKLLKYVSVTTIDEKKHEGWLKSVDPISGNLVLVSLSDNHSEVEEITLVFGDACTSLDVVKDSDLEIKHLLEKLYCDPTSKVLTPEDVENKERFIAYLKQIRLPVRESENDGGLVIAESATIYPPYGIENCVSNNGIVLGMLRKIVTKLQSSNSAETTVTDS